MNNKISQKLNEQIESCLSLHRTGDAKDLAKEVKFLIKKIEADSSNSNNGEAEKYKNLLTRLELLALPLYPEEQVAEFFKKNFLKMVNDPEIRLYDRFKTKHFAMPYEFAEDFLLQIIEALRKNEETIGKERIFISGNPEAQVPTVANWLLDYDRTYGTEPQSDLVWLEYVNSGANASRLGAKEKEILRKLLKFYEFLKSEHLAE